MKLGSLRMVNSAAITLTFLMVLSALQLDFSTRAQAVFGGKSDVGDTRVVALVAPQDNPREACGAAVITNQILVTAAHCLGNVNGVFKQEIFTPKNLWAAQPGVDLNSDNVGARIQVLRAILTAGYNNAWDPKNGITVSQKDDIAFLFLAKPIIGLFKVPIASATDVAQIKRQRMVITHIGYGNQSKNSMDGKPYLVKLQAYQKGASRYKTVALENFTAATQETGANALCPGDSGSPWYATVGGIEKIVAVTISASGCLGVGSGKSGTMGTLIYPYMHLVDSQWSKFQPQIKNLLAASRMNSIDFSLPLIQRVGQCDAYVSAWLQILKNGRWVNFKPAQGWSRVKTCPPSNPYQPWVHAKIPDGTQIRWHMYSPGNWSLYGKASTYTRY